LIRIDNAFIGSGAGLLGGALAGLDGVAIPIDTTGASGAARIARRRATPQTAHATVRQLPSRIATTIANRANRPVMVTGNR
jgi:hypothetical protein